MKYGIVGIAAMTALLSCAAVQAGDGAKDKALLGEMSGINALDRYAAGDGPWRLECGGSIGSAAVGLGNSTKVVEARLLSGGFWQLTMKDDAGKPGFVYYQQNAGEFCHVVKDAAHAP